MWPREPMYAGSLDGERGNKERKQRMSASAASQAKDTDSRQRQDAAVGQGEASQTKSLMKECGQNVPAPFPGKPGLARLRKREWVDARDPVVLEYPFTGPDLQTGIRVAQQIANAANLCEEKIQREEEREVGQ